MKKTVAIRKLLNKGILSIISALGITSFPAHASAPKDENSSDNNDGVISPNEWEFENQHVEYGCPSASFKFKGKVTDDAGNPIPDVDVVVKMCEYGMGNSKTDENGEYNIYFEDTPWCDVTISFTKDPNTMLDTTIVKENIEFENPSGHWYQGEYSREVNVIFSEQEGSKIFFNKSAFAEIVNLEEPMFRVVNCVEDYMWFSFRNVKSAAISVYDHKGTLLKKQRLNDGENLYVGDLKSGTYLLTAVSGSKRFSSIFIKK